jgi:hypothetical protein
MSSTKRILSPRKFLAGGWAADEQIMVQFESGNTIYQFPMTKGTWKALKARIDDQSGRPINAACDIGKIYEN